MKNNNPAPKVSSNKKPVQKGRRVRPKQNRQKIQPPKDNKTNGELDIKKGGDPVSFYVQNLDHFQKVVIRREIIPDFQSIACMVTGIFNSFAISGALSYTPQDYVNALFYLMGQVRLVMVGERLTVKKLPYGILCFLDALKPSAIRYKTGNIYFSWNVAGFNTGFLNFENSLLVPTDVDVPDILGFPYLSNTLVPSGIQEELEASFSHLISQMPMVVVSSKYPPANRIVDLEDGKFKTPFLTDTSIFSNAVPVNGNSSIGVGGVNVQVSSEVKIKYPMLAKAVTVTTPLLRTFSSSAYSSLTSFGSGYLIMDKTIEELGTPNRPIVKFIDMADIYLFLGSIIDAAATRLLTQNLQLPPIQTTLNPLDIFIILREMCRQIGGSYYGQYINDVVPGGVFAANVYGPFNSGPSSFNGSIQMPLGLLENLKSLSDVMYKLPNKTTLDWIPVFGLFDTEFTVSDLNELPYWTLATGGTFPTAVVMPSVSLFNLKTTPGGSFIATNVPYLETIIELWNTYIIQFAPAVEIGRFSPEVAPNVLSVLPQTRIFARPPVVGIQVTPLPPIVVDKNLKKMNSKRAFPTESESFLAKKEKKGGFGNIVWPVFAFEKVLIACISNGPFNTTLNELQSNYIWPSNLTLDQLDPTLSVDFYQSMYIESHRKEMSYGNSSIGGQTGGIIFSDLLKTMSATWLKSPGEDHSVNTGDLIELEKKGLGGFFSGMVADLVGDQLGLPPDMIRFGKMLANTLPI